MSPAQSGFLDMLFVRVGFENIRGAIASEIHGARSILS